MFDDFLEGLSSKWQEFLDWSDEKGLPIRGTSDALEEKGIPPAPFFLGLLIVVLCGIGFLVFTNLPAQTATVTITVTGSDGLAVDNANVQLSSSIEANSKFNSTNERGLARFYNVPLGKYNVSVSSANYKPNSLAITVGQAPVLQEIKLEAKPVDVNASVIVKVALASGSGNPSISITDPSKNSYGMKTGTSVTFSLPMSRNYTILAYLDGYTPNETTIRIGAANPEPITLTLFPNAAENSVEVNLQVLLSASGNVSLADAQIQMYAMPANTLVRKFMCTSEGVVKLLLDKGAKLRFIASLSGYEDGVLDYVVSSSSPTPKITLAKIGADGKSKMSCRIIDEAGNKITQATFNIYKDNKKYVTPQKTGSDGNVSFSITEDESLWVTAYKPSYIPAGMFVQKGTDCSMVLKRSLKDNSAVVKVKVVDEIGGLLSGSAVSLFGSDGPLGLSESTTGSDGLVEFSDVPLGLTHATASYKSRSGFSDTKDVAANGEAGVNYTTLSVTLVPAKGTLKFRVIDRFSRRLIDGAEIDASTSDSASCSTSSGVCTVELLEGWGRYKVYAQGYSSYSSSQVQVVPNYEKEVLVELLSNSVAENVRAVYLGMYDLEGNRVSSLEPSTAYNAKFLLNAPDLKFSQALLHVRLGGETGDVSGLDAFISGFDAGSDASTSGGSAYGSDSGANSTFDSAEGEFDTIANSIEYKWVSFSLPSFAGTREATVQVTTRQVKNGTALFGFRTAYSTSNGTLRDPADDSVRAGQDNLAAVNKTKYSISFGGICSEELCLEAHVVSSRGEYARNFEVAVPEEFTIFVKSISTGGPYELRLSSESLTAAKILSGTSPSGSASVTEDKDGQLAVVEIPSGNVDSEFKVKALRVTDVLAFKIAVDYQGEQVSELEVSGRVIASSNNELKVGTLPSVLSALVDNKLMFLVTDAYDTPLSNAHIIVGTKNDLFGDATYSLDGTGEENAGKAGKYLLENVNPGKVGRVEYAITATGYATYYGSLAANAKTILEVDPSTGISILVESKEGNTDSFTVQNKLGNAVKVAAAIVLDKSPKITSTLLSTSEFSLDPLASKEVTFDTWISESVLDVAKSTRTLSENFTGKLIIEGRVGSSKQKITIPFTVKSAFLQSPLDEFWGVQEDSAELTLSLGAQTETSTSIHVYNDLSTNLLVNYQLDSSTDWLSYSPAS
ncbi:MAG: carboxypeptidase-like regulatory domain-containing protein, partial [Candidatus Micrarchaeia archaeon]